MQIGSSRRVTTKEEIQKEYCQSKFREQKSFAVCQMVSEKRTVQSEQNGSHSIPFYKTLVQMLEDNANDIFQIRTNIPGRFLLKWVKRVKFMCSNALLQWRSLVEWSMHRGMHHRFLMVGGNEFHWNQLYKHTKNMQKFRWSCIDFYGSLEKPGESNSSTQELVLQEGLYNRNIVWHPQKGNLSKDRETNVVAPGFGTVGCSQMRRIKN